MRNALLGAVSVPGLYGLGSLCVAKVVLLSLVLIRNHDKMWEEIP